MQWGILHVCGGDPTATNSSTDTFSYSPRMWRWSHAYDQMQANQEVFSTYVEVILPLSSQDWRFESILHVCGGDPKALHKKMVLQEYSPRMWRWSLQSQKGLCYTSVFSTYVEVILIFDIFIILSKGILHVCGGDPAINWSRWDCYRYSPRMWRWSFTWLTKKLNPGVFSTHVEAK